MKKLLSQLLIVLFASFALTPASSCYEPPAKKISLCAGHDKGSTGHDITPMDILQLKIY